jgi:hypothetical protein
MRTLYCIDCHHYHPEHRGAVAVRLSEDVAQSHTILTNERAKNQTKEEDSLKTEQKIELQQQTSGGYRWPDRPTIMEYCGKYESEGIYYICRLKSVTCHEKKACGKDAGAAIRSCDTCQYRKAPVQHALDLTRIIRSAQAEVMSNVLNNNLLSGITSRVRSESADEFRFACQSAFDGHLSQGEKQYFSLCRRMTSRDSLSSESLCAWANPDQRCPFWASAKQSTDVLAVAKGTTAFTVGGFYFRESAEGGLLRLRVDAAYFEGLVPQSLSYRIGDLVPFETRALAGITGASVTVQEQPDQRVFSVVPVEGSSTVISHLLDPEEESQ